MVPSPTGENFLGRCTVTRCNPLIHIGATTLANPFGPPVRGWERVAQRQERGASNYRDGEIYDFEIVAKHVTPELAYVC